MKKTITYCILQFFLCCIYAQTSIETALPLREGTNTFTFESTEGQNTAYFVYTAPTDQGKLITIPRTAAILVSEDGSENKRINGIMDSDKAVYPIKKGQTAYFVASVYNMPTVEFIANFADAVVDGGATCDDALEAKEEEFFVPSYGSITPTFLTYTCAEDGVLEMTFGGYPSSLKISEGCGGAQEILTATYSNGKYIAKSAVEENKTYIVEVCSYNPFMASFKLTHPVLGSSCDLPFATQATDNVLPMAAGKYWYKYTAEQSGFIEISDGTTVAGARNISIYTSCGAYYSEADINGYFALRCRVNGNTSYLICIDKTDATTADEVFDITFKAPQAGDSFSNPIIVDTDNYTVSKYNGDYFYKVTVPDGSSKFLTVDATNAGLHNSSTGVKLYNANNTYSPIAQGTDFIKSEVTGGASYYILWTCREGINAFEFTISYEDIAQGDVCSDPLLAYAGLNDLKVGTTKYYNYQATKTGWLIIDTVDPTIGVSFPRDCGQYSGEYDIVKEGLATKTEVVAGTAYLIKFTNVETPIQFTLSEEDYQEGESCGTAALIEQAGITTLPERILNVWYQYVAPQSGMVTVSSDITYEQNNSGRSSVAVKASDCSAYPIDISKTNSEGTWYEGTFQVEQGDVLYINVVTRSVQAGKTLTVAIRDLQPGESCSDPILLEAGEVHLPLVERSQPAKWYAVSLQPGELSIVSDDWYEMYLYKNCDETAPLTQSGYYYDPITSVNVYRLNYTIPEGEDGTYILQLSQSYATTVIAVSGSGIATGLEDIAAESFIHTGRNAIIIVPDISRINVEIYDITGKKVMSQCINAVTSFAVKQGIYFVRMNGHVTKVLVND